MAKVYAEQVEKAKTLVAGLRKNFDAVKNRGISREQIDALDALSKEAERMNAEIEALREEVRQKAAKASKKLIEMKNQMMVAKKTVKNNFTPYKWPEFGVMDKR